MDHIRNNLKREQMLEDRYSEIDNENRILLKKMSDIMKTKNTPRTEQQQQGPQSLNRDSRKKELLRITRENQSILKRIQQAQPQYNHIQWEADHRRNQYYLQNCAEYPRVRISKREMATSELVPLQDGEHVPLTARSGAPQEPLLGIEAPLEEAVSYVLKEGRNIGDAYYLVEMSTDGRALNVAAYNGDTTLQLVVKEKSHRKLFRQTNGDYSLVADRLFVDRDGAKLLIDDSDGSMSAPATARGASLPLDTRVSAGPASSPPTARVEGGRAAKAAEGVRERTAAYLNSSQAPSKSSTPDAPGPRKASSPLPRQEPPTQVPPEHTSEAAPAQVPKKPAAAPQPQAPDAASRRPGRPDSASRKYREAAQEASNEWDADRMIVAATAAASETDRLAATGSDIDRFAATVHSAGFFDRPDTGGSGSALVCEVNLGATGDPKVHLRGLTPPSCS
jgi:E3 ubiquitin-protein ligase TRIP12